jgi:hypothetical protein
MFIGLVEFIKFIGLVVFVEFVVYTVAFGETGGKCEKR